MSDIVLGNLATENAQRDAIHIAIAPIIASQNLKVGQHIGVDQNGKSCPDSPVGIVDPFLKKGPKEGESFYILLYQNTVTGMRHHWSHPAFGEESSVPNPGLANLSPELKASSEAWLKDFIESSDCPDYYSVIAAATDGCLSNTDPEYYNESYYNNGQYLHFNGRDAHGDIPPEFWDHIEIVTGIKIPRNKRAEFWSCSC